MQAVSPLAALPISFILWTLESCSVLAAELSAPLLLQIHAIVVHRDKHRTTTGTALLTLA